MFRIQKGTIKDAEILSKISKKSFLVAHGHSAHKKISTIILPKILAKITLQKN